ncbi:MAG: Maf family protein [Synergistaceae bacterium]|nr:Maf family protein [Synergistaceae bacterium]
MIGCKYETYSPKADESVSEGESPESACGRLSVLKAKYASEFYLDPETLIIAADTLVAADDDIFGKPNNAGEARAMLNRLNGRGHKVVTGVTVMYKDKIVTETETTTVYFRKLSEEDIEAYISTGEFQGKAGAYAIQGYGSLFVERIDGDYFNVVGLPLQRLSRMFEVIGIKFKEQLNLGGG